MIDRLVAFGADQAIRHYLGSVDDAQQRLELKLDKLSQAKYEAGIRALEQAMNSERERDSLLRESRAKLNEAISLEKGLRLVYAYLGLATCHTALGDQSNARATLLELLRKPFPVAWLKSLFSKKSTLEIASCRQLQNEARTFLGTSRNPCGRCSQSTTAVTRKGFKLRFQCLACEPIEANCPICHSESVDKTECYGCRCKWSGEEYLRIAMPSGWQERLEPMRFEENELGPLYGVMKSDTDLKSKLAFSSSPTDKKAYTEHIPRLVEQELGKFSEMKSIQGTCPVGPYDAVLYGTASGAFAQVWAVERTKEETLVVAYIAYEKPTKQEVEGVRKLVSELKYG